VISVNIENKAGEERHSGTRSLRQQATKGERDEHHVRELVCELHDLLEQYAPMWYTESLRNRLQTSTGLLQGDGPHSANDHGSATQNTASDKRKRRTQN
jgi:hypothetical protein